MHSIETIKANNETMSKKFVVSATRAQMAKLAEVLFLAFQEGDLPSRQRDTFTIEIDSDPAVYCASNGEALCWSVIQEGNR